MDQVNAMLAHWQQEPPVDAIVPLWLGYKPPAKTALDAQMSPEESAAKAAAIMAAAYALHDLSRFEDNAWRTTKLP